MYLVFTGQQASGSDVVTAAEEYVENGKDVLTLYCVSSSSAQIGTYGS